MLRHGARHDIHLNRDRTQATRSKLTVQLLLWSLNAVKKV